MTRLLLSSLKIFIVLALIAAAGFGALMLADHQGWPGWVIAVAVAGLFFLIVLVLLLRRCYYRRRESLFVKRVIDHDNQGIKAAPEQERRALKELQDRWTEAISTLRSSRLRHRGDPLYTLPWFMVFGETASGKSTAVSHSRLENIMTRSGPARGIAGTKNCDWWFFDKAVILDTAGRYSVPLESEDNEEWERFLQLLSRYRRKEPLNGLIVTLPADRLLSGDNDMLKDYGRSIRLRMDQLMRVLGARFPVYILLTKMDLVLGMTSMAEILPEELRGQAMGQLNDSDKRNPEEFLDESLDHVYKRLKELRLQMDFMSSSTAGRAALFPDEFKLLAPGIKAFVQGAFHENPYQETPFFRGFFISSGRQSGLVNSCVLSSLESLKDRNWRLPETGRGLFLHDFFGTILPKDRSGFRPIREYLSWKKSTASLALGAWLLFLLTGIGLSSLSYVNIRQAMQPVYDSFPQTPEMGESLPQDIVTLGLMRDKISQMSTKLPPGMISDTGLDQGKQALDELKENYTLWFRTYILNPIDQNMRDKFMDMESLARHQALTPYLEYLVWRLDILEAVQAEKSRSDLPGRKGPIDALALALGESMPYITDFFSDMYRSYAIWEKNSGVLQRENAEIMAWAGRIIDIEGKDLRWLIGWADERADLQDITLDDFWSGHGLVDYTPSVSGAFTVSGRKTIQGLLDQVALTTPDPEDFKKRTDAFWGWYADHFIREWKNFAGSFDLGKNKLITHDDWIRTASTMAGVDNPYFNLISRVFDEAPAVQDILKDNMLEYFALESQYIIKRYMARHEHGNLQQRIADKIQMLGDRVMRMERSLEAAQEFEVYMEQLQGIQSAATSREAAYRFAMQSYDFASAEGQVSHEEAALASVNKIRHLLGRGQPEEDELWYILEGPLRFFINMITHKAACALNDLWEAQVLSETARIPENEKWDALFGDQGVVGEFVSVACRPFLIRRETGWSAGTWQGVPFPFMSEFLSFLDQGAVRRQQLKPDYTVTIATIPTNVNRDALSEPYQTRLTLQCAGEKQTLDNFNFPDSLNFTWKPATCNDVTLEVFFRQTRLDRTWEGQWGFRDFLRDFRSGRKVFVPQDFPGQKEILEGMNIKAIQVNYRIQNADPVLNLRDYPPLHVPRDAATCRTDKGAFMPGSHFSKRNTFQENTPPPGSETKNDLYLARVGHETVLNSFSAGGVP